MANLLRARLQRIRDDARAVLVSMMAELGPRYVPYACHVLRASLPDKGFTAHVIGYTLHAVLEAVVQVGRGKGGRTCGVRPACVDSEGLIKRTRYAPRIGERIVAARPAKVGVWFTRVCGWKRYQ